MGVTKFFKIVAQYRRVSLKFLQLDEICIRHFAISFLEKANVGKEA